MPAPDDPRLLFVYGSLLAGEPDHGLLAEAEPLGQALTPPAYHLVELQSYPALVPGGRLQVAGEVYRISRDMLLRIDVHKEVPRLFDRVSIELADGRCVQTYTMRLDQVPGRRRLRSGDWRQRFSSSRRPAPGPFVKWARGRRS